MTPGSITLWHYLRSRDACLTVIAPMLVYHLALHGCGAGWALALTAGYAAAVAKLKARSGSLSVLVLILFSAASHALYSFGYAPFAIAQEKVFLSVSGALSVVVVFSVYALKGQPVVRSLAEQAIPELTRLPVYGTARYAGVWQEVSLAWIGIFLLKAVGVYALALRWDAHLDAVMFICGWPLTLLMVAISVYWPKYRWTSLAR